MKSTNISKWKLQELQDIATTHQPVSIPIVTKDTLRLVTKGWLGKPEGLRQVLWERGWIDPDCDHEYKKIAIDEAGDEIFERSLLRMMESCLDFADEITQMEVMGNKMGIKILCTTKYHAELAGERNRIQLGTTKVTVSKD